MEQVRTPSVNSGKIKSSIKSDLHFGVVLHRHAQGQRSAEQTAVGAQGMGDYCELCVQSWKNEENESPKKTSTYAHLRFYIEQSLTKFHI